jgi:hypothetical protein
MRIEHELSWISTPYKTTIIIIIQMDKGSQPTKFLSTSKCTFVASFPMLFLGPDLRTDPAHPIRHWSSVQ